MEISITELRFKHTIALTKHFSPCIYTLKSGIMRHTIIFILSLLTITITHAQVKYPSFYNPSGHEKTQNQIPNTYFPVIGVWVWGPGDLMPEGYKQSIDDLSNNSPFNLIVPFLRFQIGRAHV